MPAAFINNKDHRKTRKSPQLRSRVIMTVETIRALPLHPDHRHGLQPGLCLLGLY